MPLEALCYFWRLRKVSGGASTSRQKLSREAALPVRPSSQKPVGFKTNPSPYRDIFGSAACSPAPGRAGFPQPVARAAEKILAMGKGCGGAGDTGDKLPLPTVSSALGA